ncbi:MAG TPA: hypothetical protein VE078_09500 [Thermoanaerobaculia bacterium]|nr:hypothetical protein [Thermoanaerobaculia bacterium]
MIDDGSRIPSRIGVDRDIVRLRPRQEVAAAFYRPAAEDAPVRRERAGIAEDEKKRGGGRAQLQPRIELGKCRAQPLQVGGDAAGRGLAGVAEQGEVGGLQPDPGIGVPRQGAGRRRGQERDGG